MSFVDIACWIQVNFWVQKEILSGKTMKSRGEILAHFIKIAKVSATLMACRINFADVVS